MPISISRAITKSETKYWYVMSKLDADTLMKLSAFLAKKRGEDPYAEIRAVLCGTYEPKLEQLLDSLLAIMDMGDERPSEFALELHRLCSSATIDDILKRIFLRALPKPPFNAISGSVDDSFDALAATADKTWALASGKHASVAAVSPTSGAPNVPGVNQATSVSAVSTAKPPARGRGQRQRDAKQGRQASKAVVLCPFHLKWGDAARRCLPSCSRWEPRT